MPKRTPLIPGRLSKWQLLKEELGQHHIELRVPKWLPEDALFDELARVIELPPHEGHHPTCGTIFTKDSSSVKSAEVLIGLDRDSNNMMANGVNSFLIWEKSTFKGLGLFREDVSSEMKMLEISAQCGGVIVHRGSTGDVRIISTDEIVSNKGRAWEVKPNVDSAIRSIQASAPMVDIFLLKKFLQFAFHVLSPARTGTTLVWYLDNKCPVTDSPGIGLSQASVNIGKDGHALMLAYYFSQLDGAMIFDLNGNLLRSGVHLKYSDKSAKYVSQVGGTRHTSAKRFSFDESGALCIVVSADGPVKVFSDGVSVADLHVYSASSHMSALRKVISDDGENDDRVWGNSFVETCGKCGKTSLIQQVTVAGWRDRETADCPVCGEEMYSANCFQISTRIIKTF